MICRCTAGHAGFAYASRFLTLLEPKHHACIDVPLRQMTGVRRTGRLIWVYAVVLTAATGLALRSLTTGFIAKYLG